MVAPLPDPKKYGDGVIRLCNSELIEKHLLVALSDKSKVACIFDESDVSAILTALRIISSPSLKQQELLHDMRQLYVAAFGKPWNL